MSDQDATITEIRTDTFWGSFPDGRTFDMPIQVLNGHQIGDVMMCVEHNAELDEDESTDLSFILIGDKHATVIMCNLTDDGFEIIKAIQVDRE